MEPSLNDVGLGVRHKLGYRALSFSNDGATDPIMSADELFAAVDAMISRNEPR